MNACARLADQLEDVALGETATPEFTAHLAECPACAAALERQCALVHRIDDAVVAVVRAEPSPELVAGVAARLTAAQRAPALRFTRTRLAVWLATAACAVSLFIGLRAFERPPATPPQLSALTAWRSPTVSLLEPRRIPIEPRPAPQRATGGLSGS